MNLIQQEKMNLFSNFWSPLLRPAFALTIVLMTGCSRPIVKYMEIDYQDSIPLNMWEKCPNSGCFWFTTPYESVAHAEFCRVAGHEPDSIPFSMYGFNIFTDGSMYHVTQTKRK